MIVLVTGGRHYSDRRTVHETLDKVDTLSRIELVIHGAAAGADTLAGEWAREHGRRESATPVTPEAWAVLGLAAGPARNAAMLKAAIEGGVGVVLAFPGGGGTRDMVRRAVAAGVRTLRVTSDDQIEVVSKDS